MKKMLILTVCLALLNSCGIYTKYTPQTNVPDRLFGEDVSYNNADSTSIATMAWQEFFTDSLLQIHIRKGLQNNTDLQIAALRVEEAKASLLAARLSFLPSLNFAPQASVNRYDASVAKTYSLPVTASWQLDIFGGLRNAKEGAKAQLYATEAYKDAIRTQLISDIANVYFTLLMLDEQLSIATDTEAKWKESLRTMNALKAAGMTSEAGVARTEANYHSVKTSVADLREQIRKTENAFCLLLGETPHEIERGVFSNQMIIPQLEIGLPITLLASRPDVRQAEATLAQAFYTTNAARSAFYPSITLDGVLGWTNSGGGSISNPGNWLFSAVSSLLQPIFNRGRNVANLRIAKAVQEEAKLSFVQALLNAGSEVNDALTQYMTAKEKKKMYEQQITALNRAVNSTTLQMKYGDATYLEVLTAQQELLSAQLVQTSNKFSELQGVVNLYQALGGGTENSVE